MTVTAATARRLALRAAVLTAGAAGALALAGGAAHAADRETSVPNLSEIVVGLLPDSSQSSPPLRIQVKLTIRDTSTGVRFHVRGQIGRDDSSPATGPVKRLDAVIFLSTASGRQMDVDVFARLD